MAGFSHLIPDPPPTEEDRASAGGGCPPSGGIAALFPGLPEKGLDFGEGLLAENVLHLAGVRYGVHLGDPKAEEEGCQGFVRVMRPSAAMKMYPFSRSFFMAMLTLGLE